MRSEFMYFLFLVAPWAIVISIALFYRQRRKRRAMGEPTHAGEGGNRES